MMATDKPQYAAISLKELQAEDFEEHRKSNPQEESFEQDISLNQSMYTAKVSQCESGEDHIFLQQANSLSKLQNFHMVNDETNQMNSAGMAKQR